MATDTPKKSWTAFLHYLKAVKNELVFLTDILIRTDSVSTYLNFSVKFSLGDNHGVAMFPKASSNYSMAGIRAVSADLGLPFL